MKRVPESTAALAGAVLIGLVTLAGCGGESGLSSGPIDERLVGTWLNRASFSGDMVAVFGQNGDLSTTTTSEGKSKTTTGKWHVLSKKGTKELTINVKFGDSKFQPRKITFRDDNVMEMSSGGKGAVRRFQRQTSSGKSK